MRNLGTGLTAITLLAVACGDSNDAVSPSLPPLPAVSESAHYVYHYAPGDEVDADWQETYHAWATTRLAVQLPRKIGYFRYRSRKDMGDHTGNYSTNGFANPVSLEIHTLWPRDNHEVVHLMTSTFGQPCALFSEGVAVAFSTDPAAGVFESRFNGEEVHHSARRYLDNGTLVLPLERIVESKDFRAVSDSQLSYREAGSFVRFLIDRYGLDRFLDLYRSGIMQDDAKSTIKGRFETAMGVTFEEAEAAWLEMLRALY